MVLTLTAAADSLTQGVHSTVVVFSNTLTRVAHRRTIELTVFGVHHFDLGAVASPQFVNAPFTVTVAARDAQNHIVTNFTGPVTFSEGGERRGVENFESGTWPHTPWSPDGVGEVSASYAHDGSYGLRDPEWTYRTDLQIGDSGEISWWIRPSGNHNGRAYLGFGASSNGCWSIVAAPNTDEFILQRNANYGYLDVRASAQVWQANHWYQIVVQFPSTSAVLCNLYDSDGTTLLNSLSCSNLLGVPGGIAIRSFDGFSLDTIEFGGSASDTATEPVNSGIFSNGIWTGSLSVLEPATNVVLRVLDDEGHFGFSNPFHVVPSNQPPVLLTQPASHVLLAPAPMNLSVTVYGVPPFSYQWRFNGSNLAGQTNGILTLTGASLSEAGDYDLLVTNPFGTVTSRTARLTFARSNSGAAPQPVHIRDFTIADPYPSTITVSGATGVVAKVMVRLSGLSHPYPEDIGVLLVGPARQTAILMNGAGVGFGINNVNLTFDEDVADFLPGFGQIFTGSYRPTDFSSGDLFRPPAPSAPYDANLSVFNGINPNGEWQLFVKDSIDEGSGEIAGGWSLILIGSDGQVVVGTNGSVLPACEALGAWLRRASEPTNTLNDIAFGNGRFIAVGANSRIAISTNGVDWQFPAGVFGFNNAVSLNGITFGSGLFVVVFANGYVSTSAKGTLWSGPFSTDSAQLNSVAWGNETFVAVGANGAIVTSPNGSNWIARLAPLTNDLTGVTYGNGRFVAVGTSGARIVSTNGGATWSKATGVTGIPANLADVTFGDGQFVAVGTSGTVLTSYDGLTWLWQSSRTTADLLSITYGAGRFVAVGNTADVNEGLTTSTDGMVWEALTLPKAALCNDVVFGTSNFVAVGQGGAILQSGGSSHITRQPQSRRVCVTEPVSFTIDVESGCPVTFQWQHEGTPVPGATNSYLTIAAASVRNAGIYTAVASFGTQTLLSAPASLQVDVCPALDQWTRYAPPPGSNTLNGIAGAPSQLVAVGAAGTILRSQDGSIWSVSSSSTNATLNAVTCDHGDFVAVGFNGIILTSTNAADWTLRDSGTYRVLRNIVKARGQFIIVGDQGTVLSSPDAVTWNAQDLGTNRTLLGLTWANELFITVGAGGFTATSLDGTNWTPHASGTGLTLFDVACGNGTFVAVGNVGVITMSTNGFEWIKQTSPSSNTLHGVTWANGTFVAVGAGGLILSSPDGARWTVRNSRTSQDLSDITFCGDRFVAVGDNGTIFVSGYSAAPRLRGRAARDGFELDVTGEIGVNYRVQASPILPAVDWMDLFSFTNISPVTTVRDTSATNIPQRYYRLVSP